MAHYLSKSREVLQLTDKKQLTKLLNEESAELKKLIKQCVDLEWCNKQ